MTSRRLLKAAEAIREVVSMAILTELRDPRVQNVTVTGVEVAPDMRTAKVKVSIMADTGEQVLCLRGLNSSSGFLQSLIAKRIDTRYTPRLTFEIDEGVKKSLEMAKILYDLEQERQELAARHAESESTTTDVEVGAETESETEMSNHGPLENESEAVSSDFEPDPSDDLDRPDEPVPPDKADPKD